MNPEKIVANREASGEKSAGAFDALRVLPRPVLFTFLLGAAVAAGLGPTRASAQASATEGAYSEASDGSLATPDRVRDLEAKARALADEAKRHRETLLKRPRTSRETPGACSGRVPNPVTDLCWSCMFPMILGKTVPVTVSGDLPDVETDATAFCLCGSDINVEGGLNFSFWEPLRTAEVVRHPWCFPSLGGISMEGPGSSDHARTSRTEETRRRTAFWNVHWYVSPWLFITEAVADTGCLETAPWDLAYLSELDPLWDDTVTSFLLSPDAALFTSAASGGACAVDCAAALLGTSDNALYWCSGCQGRVFPLSGWMAAMTGSLQAWHLMAHRFAQKLTREGVLFSGHGAKGQCGPYPQPLFQKDVWRTQLMYPGRTASGTSCCQPLGRSAALLGPYKTSPVTGEDGAILLWRKRDCCMTKKIDAASATSGTEGLGLGRVPEAVYPKPASRDAFSALSAISGPKPRPVPRPAESRAHNGNKDGTPSTKPNDRNDPASLLPEIPELESRDGSNGFLGEIRPTTDANEATGTSDATDGTELLTDLRRMRLAKALSVLATTVVRVTSAVAEAASAENLAVGTVGTGTADGNPRRPQVRGTVAYDAYGRQPRCDARVSVTVHPAEGPLYPHTDPDFLELLHATARRWEKSGLWQQAIDKEIAAVRRAAETPTGARMLPRETRSRLHVRHVAWEEQDRRRLQTLLGHFERRFLFVDASDPAQLAFAARLLKLDAKTANEAPNVTNVTNASNDDSVEDLAKLARLTGAAGTSSGSTPGKDARGLLPLRVVLTAGSRRAAERALPGTRIWFDQGGALTRRLGLNALPAFVRLTPEARVLFQGALTDEGFLTFSDPTDAEGVARTESTSVMPALGAR